MSQPGLEENSNPAGLTALKDRVSDDCGSRQPLKSLDDNRPGDRHIYRERKGDVSNGVHIIAIMFQY